MAEQEDEEEKLKWRVDAEVKLAMGEFQHAQAQQGVGNQGTFRTHHFSCSHLSCLHEPIGMVH